MPSLAVDTPQMHLQIIAKEFEIDYTPSAMVLARPMSGPPQHNPLSVPGLKPSPPGSPVTAYAPPRRYKHPVPDASGLGGQVGQAVFNTWSVGQDPRDDYNFADHGAAAGGSGSDADAHLRSYHDGPDASRRPPPPPQPDVVTRTAPQPHPHRQRGAPSLPPRAQHDATNGPFRSHGAGNAYAYDRGVGDVREHRRWRSDGETDGTVPGSTAKPQEVSYVSHEGDGRGRRSGARLPPSVPLAFAPRDSRLPGAETSLEDWQLQTR